MRTNKKKTNLPVLPESLREEESDGDNKLLRVRVWKRRHDRNTVTCWLSSRETRRRINEKTFKSNPLLAITVFNMDCCIRLRCLLAFKIVLNKTNFSRSSLRFPSAILDGAIPLDGWFVLSFEFGATALGSTFETAAVLSSCHCRAKFIWVRHGSSTTFGTGLILSSFVTLSISVGIGSMEFACCSYSDVTFHARDRYSPRIWYNFDYLLTEEKSIFKQLI